MKTIVTVALSLLVPLESVSAFEPIYTVRETPRNRKARR